MIRPYRNTDRRYLIELLRLNTPQYFAPSEEGDFITYLDRFSDRYFIVEENGRILGCGGFNYTDDPAIARISWDIVHPEHQGRGLGKRLVLHRINEIRKDPEIREIQVRTSQLAFEFYQKLGFTLKEIEKGYWAEGLDLYLMSMPAPGH